MKSSRRGFLLQLFALSVAPVASRLLLRQRPLVPTVRMYGANSAAGHLLRDGGYRNLPLRSGPRAAYRTVIIGGGLSGLGAAWKLQRLGVQDFQVFELAEQAGGNAAFGQNTVSAFPWGAHYIPIPTEESGHMRELLSDFGAITGTDEQGRPRFHEPYLLQAPQAKLYRFGRWQDGLLPQLEISNDDKQQYQRFFAMMDDFATAKGSDGKKAFTIPLALSSQDQQFLQYDKMTMAEFMDQRGFSSEPLRWYVNYSCRDDFGTPLEKLSAWAGIHYFAARTPYAADDVDAELLTWPEGNGWVVQRLLERLPDKVKTGMMAVAVRKQDSRFEIELVNTVAGEREIVTAERIIYAAPRFTAKHVLSEIAGDMSYLEQFSYTPWLVANLTVRNVPHLLASLPWDSVSYYGSSLGYVCATHQTFDRTRNDSVLTFYQPFDKDTAKSEREQLAARSPESLAKEILKNVHSSFPELKGKVEEVGIWVWGHAMISPRPNLIWGEARKAANREVPGIAFANSDMSGMSIAEEALYHGIRAAERVFNELGAA